jgi:hypothetical protein
MENVENLMEQAFDLAQDSVNMIECFQELPSSSIRTGCYQVAFSLLTNGSFRKAVSDDSVNLFNITKKVLEENCHPLNLHIISKNVGNWLLECEILEEWGYEEFDIDSLEDFLETYWTDVVIKEL